MASTKRQLIPQSVLRSMFEYRDGTLYWKSNPHQRKQWNTQYAGKRAGYLEAKSGYVIVCINPSDFNGLDKVRNIGLHRLIFCLRHGYYPPTVDHINGDRSDNRIENLRHAEEHENCANRKKMANNTTGVPGVRRHRDGRYEARVQFKGKRHQVGSFKTLEEAREAVIAASAKIKGEWHPQEVAYG